MLRQNTAGFAQVLASEQKQSSLSHPGMPCQADKEHSVYTVKNTLFIFIAILNGLFFLTLSSCCNRSYISSWVSLLYCRKSSTSVTFQSLLFRLPKTNPNLWSFQPGLLWSIDDLSSCLFWVHNPLRFLPLFLGNLGFLSLFLSESLFFWLALISASHCFFTSV